MKKSFFLLIVFILLCSNSYTVKATNLKDPEIHSKGAVLIEANTGKILFNKNAKVPMAPASTTKVMTAILVLENTTLKDKVLIGKNPPNADGTAIGVKEGEEFTVEDLLYSLLLDSANDAAEALAEHISGTNENFAKLMNERAKSIGCENTNFKNPSGLYEEGHVTTAYDLALITREAYKNPIFLRIEDAPFYKIPSTNITPEIRWVNNKNSLILKDSKFFYEECVGGKTGYTTLSRHTYTAIAEKDNQKLILAFLDAPDKDTYFADSKNLFEYGFSRYKTFKLFSKGDKVSSYYIDKDVSIPLLATNDFYYVEDLNTSGKNHSKDPVGKIHLEDKDLTNVSFNEGDTIINSRININEKNVGTLDLYSGITRNASYISVAKNSIDKGLSKFKASYVLTLTGIFLFGTSLIRKRIKQINNHNKYKHKKADF
ncbi:D-alanyl-D-alanine carboxypeptidase [Clostridium putrefaciens]|uniref:serine-type D-Ala-D-Ala carboxypeptidase n=1 Tax=Clostridium putrefaciens TaxID=99675 RepID=A0A381JBD1_9CLOT|nr:D-alanyl-D-alanine carboxypeptidase family protein [Clostridium putrefaciens]SUY47746.1 D-alanyl-D-alanine carboxypeptidase [Clostridium putrefaciens]